MTDEPTSFVMERSATNRLSGIAPYNIAQSYSSCLHQNDADQGPFDVKKGPQR